MTPCGLLYCAISAGYLLCIRVPYCIWGILCNMSFSICSLPFGNRNVVLRIELLYVLYHLFSFLLRNLYSFLSIVLRIERFLRTIILDFLFWLFIIVLYTVLEMLYVEICIPIIAFCRVILEILYRVQNSVYSL